MTLAQYAFYEKHPQHPACPKCNGQDVERIHHQASFAIPECYYWLCENCEHMWGIE